LELKSLCFKFFIHFRGTVLLQKKTKMPKVKERHNLKTSTMEG